MERIEGKEKAGGQTGSYPLQVEDVGHLCEPGEFVSDGPGGDGGQIGHERAQLLIELQPPQLGRDTE